MLHRCLLRLIVIFVFADYWNLFLMGKDYRKSRREEEDYVSSKDRERSKISDISNEKDKDDKDWRISSRDRREVLEEREKEKSKDKVREKDYDRYRDRDRERDRDHKDRGRDKEREKDREVEKEHHDRGRERKEKDRDREKERERPKDREREKHRDRERGKGKDKDWDKSERYQGKGKDREREMDIDDKERSVKPDQRDSSPEEHMQKVEHVPGEPQLSTSEIRQRMLKMKEERLKEASEASAWVNKSRKLESKMNSEKKKALHLSKVFEEQDNVDREEIDEVDRAHHTTGHLAGMKVLHGLDKVIEGGAVVLTLKDQNILADGDINSEVDMLINVEIGEQKQREEAYKLAKKTGIYEDKFNDEPGVQKRILPQYDDPVADEGVTLDHSGRFTDETEKKLEELRKRIQGVPTSSQFEDLNSSKKLSSDYYSHEEMLQFKKPRKKKSLRKKDKLDLDALEAEAISSGLGVGDLGSRNDPKRQTAKEEKERSEAQMRKDAYQTAYFKAEEASKALWEEPTSTFKVGEEENLIFGDDEDLYKSLEKARKLALKKRDQTVTSGPQLVASVAIASIDQSADTEANPSSEEMQENRVVFTEMEEFVWGLQLDEESHKPETEDVFMEEDEMAISPDRERKKEIGGWSEVNDDSMADNPVKDEKDEIALDETIHEVAVGKGLSGALKLLKERGTLKESIEWGGRNMDKKKSKLVGIHESDGSKEIHIERRDEFGRIMTPKEAFRNISHKFHGKGPGKMKQEKRQKQYQEELKLKHMNKSDTPSQSLERMRQTQERLGTPYLVLSGHVRPGQDSDPQSGFATVEDLPGGLTPMLGDRKVEHFLGMKRKAEPGLMPPPKSTTSIFSTHFVVNRHVETPEFAPEPIEVLLQEVESSNRSLMAKTPTTVTFKPDDLEKDFHDETEELISREQIILITTMRSNDRVQVEFLRRLGNTLKLVPPPILWIVVETYSESTELSEMLRKTGIMYRHLVYRENFTDVGAELDHQRNFALNHIEHHRLNGIVHFADVFNVYDLAFLDEIREIKDFGTWPMALVSANRKRVVMEGPVCDSSQIIGWHLKNLNAQTNVGSSLHISSFAFNSSILWDPERWGRSSSIQDTSQSSIKTVQQVIGEDEMKLKGLPQEECSKIMLWNLHLPTGLNLNR
ncbi:hypothetical protein GIB67_002108 [Kingdonia uniflora]|uniref:Glycosyltransferases n=1 Tax=Kingdonia uniflora TaxID=39325 RepID=A0A7J7KWI9_9MAGN|nr:hypothetical protein GIB67_002108 [Kingdonia uniflora]